MYYNIVASSFFVLYLAPVVVVQNIILAHVQSGVHLSGYFIIISHTEGERDNVIYTKYFII